MTPKRIVGAALMAAALFVVCSGSGAGEAAITKDSTFDFETLWKLLALAVLVVGQLDGGDGRGSAACATAQVHDRSIPRTQAIGGPIDCQPLLASPAGRGGLVLRRQLRHPQSGQHGRGEQRQGLADRGQLAAYGVGLARLQGVGAELREIHRRDSDIVGIHPLAVGAAVPLEVAPHIDHDSPSAGVLEVVLGEFVAQSLDESVVRFHRGHPLEEMAWGEFGGLRPPGAMTSTPLRPRSPHSLGLLSFADCGDARQPRWEASRDGWRLGDGEGVNNGLTVTRFEDGGLPAQPGLTVRAAEASEFEGHV